MIRAHMATYPARRDVVGAALASIAPQVDRVVLVLNEYAEVPDELRAIPKVDFVLPPKDLKDTGKFAPEAEPDDHVFLVDDDLIYATDYVAHTMAAASKTEVSQAVFGYHGSCLRQGFRKKGFVRKVWHFHRPLADDIVVDMLGTGTTYLRGRQLPPFAYMQDSQRFTDIRFAKWCHEQGLIRVCLNRRRGIIRESAIEQSIYQDFTLELPPEVFREVRAFGRRTPGAARPVRELVWDATGPAPRAEGEA